MNTRGVLVCLLLDLVVVAVAETRGGGGVAVRMVITITTANFQLYNLYDYISYMYTSNAI